MAGWADLEPLRGPAPQVAPRLLGALLRHRSEAGTVAVRMTEVEAYGGSDDPGSHGHRGPTARTAVMFGPPGRLYVYFTYGLHHCCNVVVGEEGSAAAVLLRAGEVVEGRELARSRRGPVADRDLARGPARLCQALGIDLSHNGAHLAASSLTLEPASPVHGGLIRTGPRVGLRHAADRPWRFWLPDESTVSAYRAATPRRVRDRARRS